MDTHTDANTGLSRRALIRRAGMVGAAAWTAPVILESLVSPAGALTPGPCQPYYVKLVPGQGCYSQVPGSGSGRDCGVSSNSITFPIPSGARCGSGCTMGCSGSNPGFQPTSSLNGSGYYVVTLTAGSTFSSGLTWTLGGRYDTSDNLANSSYTKLCAGAANIGDGAYVDGGTTGYVKASLTFGSTTKSLKYIYVLFCRAG